jgi:hypothetical protein
VLFILFVIILTNIVAAYATYLKLVIAIIYPS